jgi:hypothetical protein
VSRVLHRHVECSSSSRVEVQRCKRAIGSHGRTPNTPPVAPSCRSTDIHTTLGIQSPTPPRPPRIHSPPGNPAHRRCSWLPMNFSGTSPPTQVGTNRSHASPSSSPSPTSHLHRKAEHLRPRRTVCTQTGDVVRHHLFQLILLARALYAENCNHQRGQLHIALTRPVATSAAWKLCVHRATPELIMSAARNALTTVARVWPRPGVVVEGFGIRQDTATSSRPLRLSDHKGLESIL